MTGSEADTKRELEENESGHADSVKLAKFLTPVPRPKSSMPPPPSPSELKPAPVPLVVPERTSLFSDLPIPRKNSSLRPPAPVTESTRAEAPRAEPAEAPRLDAPVLESRIDSPAPRQRPKAPIDGFHEVESPTANLTLEKDLAAEEPERDLETLPLSRSPLGQKGMERAAIAAAALIATFAIAFAVKRVMSSRTSAAPAAAIAEEPRTANAPPVDTFQPAEEADLPTSSADPAKARELRLEARQLLEKGSAEEGTRVARLAIQADPNDAEGYILLAAGLQDLGRWQESRDVFAKCVQESNRKANAECVYFATRSQ